MPYDPCLTGFLEVVRDEGETSLPWSEATAKGLGLIRYSDRRKRLILTDAGRKYLRKRNR
jgi:hypothetical protein